MVRLVSIDVVVQWRPELWKKASSNERALDMLDLLRLDYIKTSDHSPSQVPRLSSADVRSPLKSFNDLSCPRL